MVIFETTPGREFSTLRIVGPEEDKVTTLVAHPPLYRGCVAKWPLFRTPTSERSHGWSSIQEKVLHLKGSDQESSDPPQGFHFLGSMIAAGRVQWKSPLKVCGNFDYIPGYWEWAENVRHRCGAILTSASLIEAVQASLCVYDYSDEFLKAFCRLFDEVVPTTECLSQSLGDEARILVSCWFLLSGYHYLAAQSPDRSVSIYAWIGFWNRSYVGYEVADQSNSKMVCPRRSSVFDLCPWNSADRDPFDVLRVSVDLEEEIYCAPFLACWLCVFLFPTEPLDLIHVSVFKMASFMANGSRVSLVPLVLACIYRSLSQISLSDNPFVAPGCFPAHYLFGWLRSYLHAQHTATSRLAGPQMMKYHGKGRGKVYVLSEARTILRSCPFRYTPTIPGLSSSTREMVDLAIGLEFWRSSGSSKRRCSSSSIMEDRDPNHARGVRKETSSSRGSRVVSPVRRSLEGVAPSVAPDDVIRDQVVEVSSSVSSQEHTELVDTGESPECLAIEVAESCPPALPTLTIAQGAEAILRT
ncbi:hypothetical protein LIER_16937 [Lithospermum erythrorhizon]|uniref:Aminotransferase-like plant mobile domain-containing protein n=1 Tax=Lithospermum erythrorhizon TaxID=34254 RepID=A0AAV3QA50_LITER